MFERGEKITIAMPCKETVPIQTLVSILNLYKPEYYFLSNNYIPLDKSRNDMAAKFLTLHPDANYLLFYDSDMVAPRDALLRLYQHEAPIVGALYFQKYPPFFPVAGCLPKGSIVLNNPKFTTIENSNSLIGKNGSETTIKSKMDREYSGILYRIKTRLPWLLEITEEHPVYAIRPRKYFLNYQEAPSIYWGIVEREGWFLPHELRHYDYLCIPKYNLQEQEIQWTEEECKWFGFYVAEGCVQILKRGKRVNIYNSNPNKIREYSKTFKCKMYNRTKDNRGYVISVNNTKFANYIENQFGRIGNSKKIPKWLLTAPREKRLKFLEGFIEGDGHKDYNKTLVYSSSWNLILDLYSLLWSLDIIPWYFYEERNKNYKGYKWISKEHILGWSTNSRIKSLRNFYLLPIKGISTRFYRGPVYNFETESESYCTPFLVHNCRISREKTKAVHLLVQWQERQVFPVDALGLGFTLIRRDVFQKLEYPWFEFKELSEDFEFMYKAQKAGFKVLLDSSILCLHKSDTVFIDRDFYNLFQRKLAASSLTLEGKQVTAIPISRQ